MLRLAYHLLAAEEGGVEEEEEDIFLIPNATMLVEFVLFGLVLFVVWKFIVPPVAAAMAQREAKLAGQLSDTEAATRMITEAHLAYEAAMTEARGEATRLREEARATHKSIVDSAAATAQAQVDQITATARAQLGAERDQALASLQEDVSALAGQLAGRVVGEPV
ncbi:MAG: F0F1 ATP synthase subunit B [Sporichthyaceae bacterium]